MGNQYGDYALRLMLYALRITLYDLRVTDYCSSSRCANVQWRLAKKFQKTTMRVARMVAAIQTGFVGCWPRKVPVDIQKTVFIIPTFSSHPTMFTPKNMAYCS